MSIENDEELQNTREKLVRLEKHYAESRQRPLENPSTREISLRSLKRMINQLKEEIIRYEARAKAAAGARESRAQP